MTEETTARSRGCSYPPPPSR